MLPKQNLSEFGARLSALEVTGGGEGGPLRPGGSFCNLRGCPSGGRSAQGRAEAEIRRSAIPGSSHPTGAARRNRNSRGIAEAAVAGHLRRCRPQSEYGNQQDSGSAGRLGGKPQVCRNAAASRLPLHRLRCGSRGYAAFSDNVVAEIMVSDGDGDDADGGSRLRRVAYKTTEHSAEGDETTPAYGQH